ncbi:MAG TPA: hypothetical protein VHV83_12720 [Armatimonadota bacterium]|nr:hypothetical protein [Armatimonadota bacterium]
MSLTTPQIVTLPPETLSTNTFRQTITPAGVAHLDGFRKQYPFVEIGVAVPLNFRDYNYQSVEMLCSSLVLRVNESYSYPVGTKIGFTVWAVNRNGAQRRVTIGEGIYGIGDYCQLYMVRNVGYSGMTMDEWAATSLVFRPSLTNIPSTEPITSAVLEYTVVPDAHTQGGPSDYPAPLDKALNFRFAMYPQPLPLDDPDGVFDSLQVQSPLHRARRHH